MATQHFSHQNLLTLDEIARVEASNLSAFQKHHVRVIAYSLASFKAMSTDCSMNVLPDQKTRLNWCTSQSPLAQDPTFIPIFLEQLDVAAIYLEKVADQLKVLPCEITIEHLITFASAD